MGGSSIEDYEPRFLFELAHWAKEHGILRPWERSLVFNIGRYISKGWRISAKQERHTLRIIQEAREAGFEQLREKSEADDWSVTRSEVAQLETRGVRLDEIGIEELELEARSYNALRRNNVKTLRQLVNLDLTDLLRFRNLGDLSASRISQKVKSYTKTVLVRHHRHVVVTESISVEKEIRELVDGICGMFQNLGLIDEVHLPPRIGKDLNRLSGRESLTLGDLKRWASQDKLEDTPPVYLEDIWDWLQMVESYRSVDDEVHALTKDLSDRELFILRNRWGIADRMTLEEIGDRYGKTRERIRQLEGKLKQKLIYCLSRVPILCSEASLILLRRLGDETSMDLWVNVLVDNNLIIDKSSAELLLSMAEATHSPRLPLQDECLNSVKSDLPPKLVKASRSILNTAHRLNRNCGAVRGLSLINSDLTEEDVIRILSSNGFGEVYPGWWVRQEGEYVPGRVARKVITYCGPVTPSMMRYSMRKHLSRLELPTPPSEVLAKALERWGGFSVIDGLIRLRDMGGRKPSLRGPESIFVDLTRTEGPVVSFENVYNKITEAGFSSGSVTSILRYSPIIRRVTFSLYTLVGARYDAVDVARAQSEMTRIKAKYSLRPRSDGVVEFEVNVGSWLRYGGVIAAGPAGKLRGAWTIVAGGIRDGELVVGDNLIQGLSQVAASLDIAPGDRIRIGFNTWTRRANIEKVMSNEES